MAWPEVAWSEAARERLERIPIAFIREKVRRGIEAFAASREETLVTLELMDEGLQGSGRMGAFGRRPGGGGRGR